MMTFRRNRSYGCGFTFLFYSFKLYFLSCNSKSSWRCYSLATKTSLYDENIFFFIDCEIMPRKFLRFLAFSPSQIEIYCISGCCQIPKDLKSSKFSFILMIKKTLYNILTAPAVKSATVNNTMSVDITRKTIADRAAKYSSILSKFTPHILSAFSMYRIKRINVSMNTIKAAIQNASPEPQVVVRPILVRIEPMISKI